MGVIAKIIQTRCNCEGDEPCIICKDTEKKIIAEIEKCLPGHQSKDRFNDESQEYSYIQGYNQAVSDILSNIKKLKEPKS
jgi:hypothetical protein